MKNKENEYENKDTTRHNILTGNHQFNDGYYIETTLVSIYEIANMKNVPYICKLAHTHQETRDNAISKLTSLSDSNWSYVLLELVFMLVRYGNRDMNNDTIEEAKNVFKEVLDKHVWGITTVLGEGNNTAEVDDSDSDNKSTDESDNSTEGSETADEPSGSGQDFEYTIKEYGNVDDEEASKMPGIPNKDEQEGILAKIDTAAIDLRRWNNLLGLKNVIEPIRDTTQKRLRAANDMVDIGYNRDVKFRPAGNSLYLNVGNFKCFEYLIKPNNHYKGEPRLSGKLAMGSERHNDGEVKEGEWVNKRLSGKGRHITIDKYAVGTFSKDKLDPNNNFSIDLDTRGKRLFLSGTSVEIKHNSSGSNLMNSNNTAGTSYRWDEFLDKLYSNNARIDLHLPEEVDVDSIKQFAKRHLYDEDPSGITSYYDSSGNINKLTLAGSTLEGNFRDGYLHGQGKINEENENKTTSGLFVWGKFLRGNIIDVGPDSEHPEIKGVYIDSSSLRGTIVHITMDPSTRKYRFTGVLYDGAYHAAIEDIKSDAPTSYTAEALSDLLHSEGIRQYLGMPSQDELAELRKATLAMYYNIDIDDIPAELESDQSHLTLKSSDNITYCGQFRNGLLSNGQILHEGTAYCCGEFLGGDLIKGCAYLPGDVAIGAFSDFELQGPDCIKICDLSNDTITILSGEFEAGSLDKSKSSVKQEYSRKEFFEKLYSETARETLSLPEMSDITAIQKHALTIYYKQNPDTLVKQTDHSNEITQIQNKNGTIYAGQFKDGYLLKGKITKLDGCISEGQFIYGNLSEGYSLDQYSFEHGTFKNSKLDGPNCYRISDITRDNITISKGTFSDGGLDTDGRDNSTTEYTRGEFYEKLYSETAKEDLRLPD
jgi:hypothetical protein